MLLVRNIRLPLTCPDPDAEAAAKALAILRVSSRKAAVSSVMVMGEVCHRRFISFHSLLERSIFMVHLTWYTFVYLLCYQRSRKVDKCQPRFGYKLDTEKFRLSAVDQGRFLP